MTDLKTVWRIVGIPDYGNISGRTKLDVLLTVDTTAAAVVDTIERAARQNGVQLERVEAE